MARTEAFNPSACRPRPGRIPHSPDAHPPGPSVDPDDRTGAARGGGGAARPRAGRLRHLPRRGPARLAGEGRGRRRAGRASGRARARCVRRAAASPRPSSDPSATAEPMGCDDPDPQVVATCLAPVSAVAVLPDARTALVAERTTGRVLRVQRGTDPVLVTTVPVDATGGGGLTGLVLSPGYAEDRLVYAYATTADDNRVLRLAPGEEPKPVLTGHPARRAGQRRCAGDRRPQRAAGGHRLGRAPAGRRRRWPGKLLRIDTLGRPAADNPDPASPIFSSGLRAPGGVCADGSDGLGHRPHPAPGTCSTAPRPGALGDPAWTLAGPARASRVRGAARAAAGGRRPTARAVFVLRPDENGTFTGAPETLLQNRYGRLSAAATAPDGLLWLGTTNKGSGGQRRAQRRPGDPHPAAGGRGRVAAREAARLIVRSRPRRSHGADTAGMRAMRVLRLVVHGPTREPVALLGEHRGRAAACRCSCAGRRPTSSRSARAAARPAAAPGRAGAAAARARPHARRRRGHRR